MRFSVMAILATLACSGVASAQSTPPTRGYVEGVAESAFGNVTSQSFGGEVGVTVRPGLQVFVDAGQVRDVATSDLGINAQMIAGYLAQSHGGVTFGVKEPVTFGTAGVRYRIGTAAGRVEPYVVGAAGAARISKNVSFAVAGSDVTGTLQQYGVVLGTDLSGSETRPMLAIGGGVAVPLLQWMVADLQYRYGRIFASDQGINVNRAGIGLGVRF